MDKKFVCTSPKAKTVMAYMRSYYGDYGTFEEENYVVYITWLNSKINEIDRESVLNEIRVFGMGVYAALNGGSGKDI